MSKAICNCACHQVSGMRHTIPCCRGRCSTCDEYVRDFKAHKAECEVAQEPSLGLLREFQRNNKPTLRIFRITSDPDDKRLFVVRNGLLYHYNGTEWSKAQGLLPEDKERQEVKGLRV